MRIIWVILLSAFWVGCSTPTYNRSSTLLISMYYPNHDYQNWLSEKDSSIQFFQAYGMSSDSLDIVLKNVDAILLTGGQDIDPSAFGLDSLRKLCGPINAYRDSLEYAIIDYAFRKDIPLFGGCRGMQIINVNRGGSLIVDLPSMRNTTIHRQPNGDSKHGLIDQGLSDFLGVEIPAGTLVNSNHHQAIDQLAKGFKILAAAEDSVPEAIIWKDTSKGPEIICWQWHPERMDRGNPYSSSLRNHLISTIQRSSENR